MLQKFAETRKIPPPPDSFFCCYPKLYIHCCLQWDCLDNKIIFYRELQQDYFFSLNNENLVTLTTNWTDQPKRVGSARVERRPWVAVLIVFTVSINTEISVPLSKHIQNEQGKSRSNLSMENNNSRRPYLLLSLLVPPLPANTAITATSLSSFLVFLSSVWRTGER
jgi:hypothetical protein